jgi:hypothetical protein
MDPNPYKIPRAIPSTKFMVYKHFKVNPLGKYYEEEDV